MFDVFTTTMVRSISGRLLHGSLEHREIVEHLGHFVAALAAADVDDDVHVGELGDRLLQQRLAGAEAAGKDGTAAARQREQEVDAALAR